MNDEKNNPINPEDEKAIAHRIITKLNRQEMDFLDKLKKDARFSTGHKLTYNDVVKALVDFAMETGLSGKDVSSKESLKEKIFQETLKHVEEKLAGMDFGALLEASNRKEQEKLLAKKLSEINIQELFKHTQPPQSTPGPSNRRHARHIVRILAWTLIAIISLVIAGERMQHKKGTGRQGGGKANTPVFSGIGPGRNDGGDKGDTPVFSAGGTP